MHIDVAKALTHATKALTHAKGTCLHNGTVEM